MADTVAWGGPLGVLVDQESGVSVQIRTFGSFEGTLPDREAVKPLILEGVRPLASCARL